MLSCLNDVEADFDEKKMRPRTIPLLISHQILPDLRTA
jgi:hypothetical protein